MEEKAEITLQLKNHHDAADFAYDCKKRDKELSRQDKSVKMFSFDLQQCLPTPYLKASMFFYKRPLWTFNLTIHDGATNKANCYIWHEAIAKRGANDIGSCIYKCLASLSNDVKHVILYSDSCTGQNRNSYICAMFAKVLEDHPTIETIDHKFLVVGHTHLECDTVHAQIEKKKKYTSVSIQHPHDWSNLIAATNKKYITQEMKQEEFYNFNALMKDKYTWRNNNTEGEKFEWKFVRWLRYVKKEPGLIRYKYSLGLDDPFKELNIKARRRRDQNYELAKSYTGPLPISANKNCDLLDMLPLVNPQLHSFYRNLKVKGESVVEIDSDLDEIEENL
ncbi:uncharacterized protein LOC120770666 [Bactrocera tryoni]|uniref:uncharacterized protein LOC120770666 n=1 Tax=Bactrocera tryoni TaxID=59916 RepID=UPI001A96D407|nr:uncharacterized protein LOC120770666 [Bactrocera tryoni]